MATLEIAGLEESLESMHLGVPLTMLDSTNVLSNPLDVCRVYLADILASLVECSPEAALKSIQWPNNIYSGDLAVILPRLCPGAKAGELAVELMKKFPQDHALFPLPFLEGVHFRIFLETTALARLVLPFIIDRKSAYGNNATLRLQEPSASAQVCKKLVVEFSSPNIWDEFQAKHLRSTILGAFVSKLHENMGWAVTRINYLGDWGKNIALLKVGWEKFGNEEAYQADPVGHLLDVYHQIFELFKPEVTASRRARDEAAKNGHDEGEAQAEIENQGIYAERNAASRKLEDGDEEAVGFWKRVRDANIENYTDFYSQLGVKFDEYIGESQVSPEVIAEVEAMLKEKGICEESAGAWVVHMQKHGLRAGTAILRDRTGATMYLLRDLAAVVERSRKFEFDRMIIVAASDNSAHFTQMHHILKAMDLTELADKVQHLKFSEVSRMAEKLGKAYKPQAILNHIEEAIVPVLEADMEKARIFGGPEKGAKALGVATLLTHELSARTNSAHSFDTAAMTAFKPGTGPELQYWYTKLSALLEENSASTDLSDEDYEAVAENGSDLLRVLAQYPEVMHATYQSLEPAGIVSYLTNVVEQLSDCLSEGDADDEDAEKSEGGEEAEKGDTEKSDGSLTAGHAALYEATRIVLENGMRLLGMDPYVRAQPERADTPVAG